MMVSIMDIAREAGVSASTVSRVINGRPYANAEKRRRILELVEETGYIPNRAARNMVLRRSFTVGIVVPASFNMFRRQLFSVIESRLNSFGYHTMFFLVNPGGSGERECLDRIKPENPDGLIMLHEVLSAEFYRYLAAARIPVISTVCNDSGVPTVTLDDRAAAREAADHLIALGHRKIRMISGLGFSYGKKRLEGYLDALAAAGIISGGGGGIRAEGLTADSPQYSPRSGMEAMSELLGRGGDFTAVFASSDELAIGAVRTLRDRGITVPGDVSVIGFDDIDISGYLYPRLTTIRQPIAEIGELAAERIHRLISGAGGQEPDTLLPHRLVVRESTCPPKGISPPLSSNAR